MTQQTAITNDAPTWADVLDGNAHLIADGNLLRASIPAMYSDDPAAHTGIVVTVYPKPGWPDHYDLFRLDESEPGALKAAVCDRYKDVSVRWDD